MKRLALPLIAFALLLPAATHAHDAWILPSATVLSGKATWVTVDAAVGNEKFFFNHRPLNLQGLEITSPEGKPLKAKNLFTSELRSGFDVHLSEPGTYRIALVRNGLSAQWKEDGKMKRWFGTSDDFAQKVPQNAAELKVHERASRVETFVTQGKPSSVTNIEEGISLIAITHPNDLFAGEAAQFIMTVDGKPARQASIEIEPEGKRYRNVLNTINLKTDDEGKFEITWPHAGRFWLAMETTSLPKSTAFASTRTLSYSATLEVLPQ